MANVIILGNAATGVRNFAVITAAFALSGLKMPELFDAQKMNFDTLMTDGLERAFNDGLLQAGVTDFLLEHGEDNAAYPFDFTNDEVVQICQFKMPNAKLTYKDGFRAGTTNQICQAYADCLRAAGLNLDELDAAETKFKETQFSVRSETETVEAPTVEAPTTEPLTVAEQLVENTADILDEAGTVAMYEALFSETVDASAIDAPTLVSETEVLPEPPVETSPVVPLPEFEPEISNADLAIETVVDAPIEIAETVETVLEQVTTAEVIADTRVVTKPVFVSQVKDLAATVAQVGDAGIFAHVVEKKPRELKVSQTLDEKIAYHAAIKAKTQNKSHQPSKQKTALKYAKKQAAREFAITGVSFNAGKVNKAFALAKPLHCLYPYLGRNENNGVPSPVGRVSMPMGSRRFATAGSHESNLQAGFFHPSCVITVKILDNNTFRYFDQQITVPYIIEAPVGYINTPKGWQPNMVIQDTDTIRCCAPIWVEKKNIDGIVNAICAGHKMIGEYKAFGRKQLFMVFVPSQPVWKNLNQAVEFSTPYPTR